MNQETPKLLYIFSSVVFPDGNDTKVVTEEAAAIYASGVSVTKT